MCLKKYVWNGLERRVYMVAREISGEKKKCDNKRNLRRKRWVGGGEVWESERSWGGDQVVN